MTTRGGATPDSAPHVLDERWEIVNRVVASAPFQRSRRLRELLFYICEWGIQNRPEELREQLIGQRVLGRQPDYNPSEDNIVRVEMRMLRKRLEEYFSGEGKTEPIVITVPKGSYMPTFTPAPCPLPSLTVELLPEPPRPTTPAKRPNLLLWAQSFIIFFLAISCLWLWQAKKHATPAATLDATSNLFWSLLFNEDHQTSIVCSDTSLVVAQALLHRPISLDEYLTDNYAGTDNLPRETTDLFQHLQHWQYTNISDTRLVQRLSEINAGRWRNTSIRSARTAQIQDFKHGNVIVLGSPRSNPWSSLFEQQLNFRFQIDESTGLTSIVSKTPLPGEQSQYLSAHRGEAGVEYSTVALVPNLRGTGNVLLIAGASAEGTEAAGEFLLNSENCARLLERLGKKDKGKFPCFEALLQSPTVADIARRASIVTVRLLPGSTVARY